MFSLFFTTPADPRRGHARRQQYKKPSGAQTFFTWVLLLIWFVLMSFAGVSLLSPRWLEEAARPGIEAEARAYKNYGDAALRQHDYPLAIAQYVRSLVIQPGQVRVLLNLAVACMHAGNTARAAELLGTALEMEPSRFSRGAIYYNLGELLERQGKRGQAIQYYQQALESGAEQDKVYRELGSLYYEGQQYEQARQAFEKSLASQLDPCRSYRDMLHRSLDIYENDETYLSIVNEELARNTSAEDLARFDLEIIRRLQQSDAEIAKTHNYLGDIHGRLGNIPAALAHCHESLRIWPGNPDATRMLALLERLQERQP